MKTLFFAAALLVSSSAMAQDYYGGYQYNDYLRPGSQPGPGSQPEVGRMKSSDYESMRNRINQPILGSDMDSRYQDEARERLDREEERRKERNHYDGY